MGYDCKILADSVNEESGVRLTTFEVTFPRFLLAEVNTHRVLSRCSASSRAIPVSKRIAAVEADPFVPLSFGKNKKGMQADEPLAKEDAEAAEALWRADIAHAIESARQYAKLGVHKQLANRVLELYGWHTAIISGTKLENFFNLRNHHKAQPEFQVIAAMMEEAYLAAQPTVVEVGSWHLPFVTQDTLAATTHWSEAPKISSGRCARVSYLTHDGVVDTAADMRLADSLMNDGHMSPLEHPAMACSHRAYGNWPASNYHPSWVQYRKMIPNEAVWPRDKL